MLTYLKVLIPFLGVLFFAILALMVHDLLSNNPGLSEEETGELRAHHYAFFIPSLDYQFFQDLKKGASYASEAMNCAISFLAIDSSQGGFRYAAESGFDGMAFYPWQGDVDATLDAIARSGLPLVMIENEVPSVQPSYFIGTSSYDSGRGIGKLGLQVDLAVVNMLILYSQKNPGLLSDSRLLEMGITEVMGSRLGSLETRVSGLNPLDAGKVTYDLIRGDNRPQIIVLTDLNDTLVTAQAIIDLNMVGQIRIIGFGDNETIRDYIDKGVLLGSVVRNAYRIGFSAVMALNDLSNNGYTSAYVDTGISILGSDEMVIPVRDYQAEDQ